MSDTPSGWLEWIRAVAKFVFGLRLPLGNAAMLAILLGIPQIVELGDAYTVVELPLRFALSWTAALMYLAAFREVFMSRRAPVYFGPKPGAYRLQALAVWLTLGLAGGAPMLFNAALWSRGLDGRLSAGLCVLMPVAAAVMLWLTSSAKAAERPRRRTLKLEIREFLTLVFGALVFAAMTWAVLNDGATFARTVGPVTLLFVFLSLVLLVLSPIEFLLNKLSIPAYTLLLLATLWGGYTSSGGDNLVRRLEGGTPLPQQKAGTDPIGKVFADWLACRRDFAGYLARKEPYPVFVIAAEGGGTYAAIHANAVLSKLQAANPKFAEHVFMVSGVSGGSMGAAAFSAAMSLRPQQPRPASCAVPETGEERPHGIPVTDSQAMDIARQVASADHLAPVAGATLFPNFLQLYMPRDAPSLDRARWFEFGLEESWSQAVRLRFKSDGIPNPFAKDYFAFWSPGASFPGLVFNVVDAVAGSPMIIAPFGPLPTREKSARAVAVVQVQANAVRTPLELSEDSQRTIALSTAVGMSARFPYVFGPAAIRLTAAGSKNELFSHFVDGGYYDATGINVAALIHAHLSEAAAAINARIPNAAPPGVFAVYLINIGAYTPLDAFKAQTTYGGLAFPILALNNTRAARARNTQVALRISGIPRLDFKLAPDKAEFPLGLYVGQATANRIEKRVGSTELCRDPFRGKALKPLPPGVVEADTFATEADVVAHNSCNIEFVSSLLSRAQAPSN